MYLSATVEILRRWGQTLLLILLFSSSPSHAQNNLDKIIHFLAAQSFSCAGLLQPHPTEGAIIKALKAQVARDHSTGIDSQIGIGVLIVENQKILLNLRRNSHGSNTWGTPGGKLENEEGILECAHREVEEETGLKIQDLEIIAVSRDIFPHQERPQPEIKIFYSVSVRAKRKSGLPVNKEPHRFSQDWQWFDWTTLPAPLFSSVQTLKDTGFTP